MFPVECIVETLLDCETRRVRTHAIDKGWSNIYIDKQPRPSHEKNDGTIVGVGIAEVEDEDVAVNAKLEGAVADEELCG